MDTFAFPLWQKNLVRQPPMNSNSTEPIVQQKAGVKIDDRYYVWPFSTLFEDDHELFLTPLTPPVVD